MMAFPAKKIRSMLMDGKYCAWNGKHHCQYWSFHLYLPPMLKRILSILLIFTIISVHFGRLFIFAGFELNQSYIAKALCINRDKPKLHCEGKCYLMKKLDEAEKKQQAQERTVQKNLFQEIATLNNQKVTFHSSLIAIIEHAPDTNYGLVLEIKFFHPPSC